MTQQPHSCQRLPIRRDWFPHLPTGCAGLAFRPPCPWLWAQSGAGGVGLMWPFPGLPCLGAGHRVLGQGHAWPWVQVSGLTQWQGMTVTRGKRKVVSFRN